MHSYRYPGDKKNTDITEDNIIIYIGKMKVVVIKLMNDEVLNEEDKKTITFFRQLYEVKGENIKIEKNKIKHLSNALQEYWAAVQEYYKTNNYRITLATDHNNIRYIQAVFPANFLNALQEKVKVAPPAAPTPPLTPPAAAGLKFPDPATLPGNDTQPNPPPNGGPDPDPEQDDNKRVSSRVLSVAFKNSFHTNEEDPEPIKNVYEAKDFIKEGNQAIEDKIEKLKTDVTSKRTVPSGKSKYNYPTDHEKEQKERQELKLKEKEIYSHVEKTKQKPELMLNTKNEAIFVPMRPKDTSDKDVQNATTVNIDAIRKSLQEYKKNYGKTLYSIEAVLHTTTTPPKEYTDAQYRSLTDKERQNLLLLCAETMIAGTFPALNTTAYAQLVNYANDHKDATLQIGDLPNPVPVNDILDALRITMTNNSSNNKWEDITKLTKEDFKQREKNALMKLLESNSKYYGYKGRKQF